MEHGRECIDQKQSYIIYILKEWDTSLGGLKPRTFRLTDEWANPLLPKVSWEERLKAHSHRKQAYLGNWAEPPVFRRMAFPLPSLGQPERWSPLSLFVPVGKPGGSEGRRSPEHPRRRRCQRPREAASLSRGAPERSWWLPVWSAFVRPFALLDIGLVNGVRVAAAGKRSVCCDPHNVRL